MSVKLTMGALLVLGAASVVAPTGRIAHAPGARPKLESVAYRVHRMAPMLAFYREAFGFEFREVDTGGLRSHFGELDGLTLKFVPIRDGVDFENFPIHQLGFEVPDVEAVVALAQKHGGRVQDRPRRDDGRLHASVRDPDGNTLELYGPR